MELLEIIMLIQSKLANKIRNNERFQINTHCCVSRSFVCMPYKFRIPCAIVKMINSERHCTTLEIFQQQHNYNYGRDPTVQPNGIESVQKFRKRFAHMMHSHHCLPHVYSPIRQPHSWRFAFYPFDDCYPLLVAIQVY